MLSGALAFYALLSVAPVLSFMVETFGLFVGRRQARGQIIDWSTQTLGPGAARIVRGVVETGGYSSSFATIAGVVSLFFGATMVFGALQDVLNLVWEVPAHERGYIRQFFFKRLVSFVAVTVAGTLLVAALLIDALISAAVKFVPQQLPATEFLLPGAFSAARRNALSP